MEGLAAAASVIAILQITTAILKCCNSIKGRESDIKNIVQRLESLKNVLYRLNDLETRAPAGALPGLKELHDGPLPACQRDVLELQDRLQRALGATGIRGIGKRISWPDEKKDIAKLLDSIDQTKMLFILALSSDHAQQGIDIKQSLSALDERIASGKIGARHEAILRWLNSGFDPSKNQTSAWKKHQPSTGDWLICGQRYAEWKKGGRQSLMWLHGIPGCGKTVLCSTIINDLMFEVANYPDSALAYFYYDFNEEHDKRTNAAMLRSLVGQLACQRKEITQSMDMVYMACAAGSRTPTEIQLSDMFLDLVAWFKNVFIVIDALDESVERVEFPAVLTKARTVHVLTASRYLDDVALSLKAFDPVEIVANARIDDIRVHVKARLALEPRLARLTSDVKKQIETKLVNESDGMFRWVECQLDALRKCRTCESLNMTLASLPKTLDQTYERVLAQFEDEDREFAIVAMQWLTFSARPLRLLELADVLALRPGPVLDTIFTPADVLLICSSLVTLDTDGFLKFSHFTVKEYLLSNRILKSKVSVFAIHEKQALRCIVERSVAYLCLFDRPDSLDAIDTTHKALMGSPHTLKQFTADENLWESFSSRSSTFKPQIKCYRSEQTKQELHRIAMRLEHRLLDYASLFWFKHIQQMLFSDIQELSNILVQFFCNDQTYLNWVNARDIATAGMVSRLDISDVFARFPGRLALGLDLGVIEAVSSLMMENELDYSVGSPCEPGEIKAIGDTLMHIPSSKTDSFRMTAILLNNMYPRILDTLDLERTTDLLESGDKDLLDHFRATSAALGQTRSSISYRQRPTLIKLLLQNDCLEFLRRLVNDQDEFLRSWLCFAIRTSSDRCISFLVDISPTNLWATETYFDQEVPCAKFDDLMPYDGTHPFLLAVEAKRPKIFQVLVQHDQKESEGTKVIKANLAYELALRRIMDEVDWIIPSANSKIQNEIMSTISNLTSQIRGFDIKGGHLHLFCKALKTCNKGVIEGLIMAHKLAQSNVAASSKSTMTRGPDGAFYWEFRMREALRIRSYIKNKEESHLNALLFCQLGLQHLPQIPKVGSIAIYAIPPLVYIKMEERTIEASYDNHLRRLIEGSAAQCEAEISGLSLRTDIWHVRDVGLLEPLMVTND